MKKSILLLYFFTFPIMSMLAQYYPGGVTGAEVWYISDTDLNPEGVFDNLAETKIMIQQCASLSDDCKQMFNFNPSLYWEKLCLSYIAPLENTTGRDTFFVGEPKNTDKGFSHVATLWRRDLNTAIPQGAIGRNFFNLNLTNISSLQIFAEYASDKNASINYYRTRNYHIDRKFKSYGQEGETEFFIGIPTLLNLSEIGEDLEFEGSFPEFVSFPRELSYNERNRVESYLALKYGLTLNKQTSYRDSGNLIFWEESNNKLFPNRIFGFGRDDVSTLNQLQSESTHLKKHLVGAIGEIMDSNSAKQEDVSIQNHEFLVFGDNDGKLILNNSNELGIKFWDKVWLAQRTGDGISHYKVHFKLFLTEELVEFFRDNPKERLWLLQDKHIGNNEVSDFDNNQIVYYPGEIDLDQGIGYFKDVFFDTDQSVYDQFTFGIGGEMLVHAQITGCRSDRLEANLEITGGSPPYHIRVEWNGNSFEDQTQNSTFTFPIDPGIEYQVFVEDVNGFMGQTEFTSAPWDFNLDLGPDQNLNVSTPEIILNAGMGISDPEATYEWYLNDVELETMESSLTVSDPGTYKVIVTSGDHSCTVEDEVYIGYDGFTAQLTKVEGCDELHNSLTIDIEGGTGDFVTILTGPSGPTNYTHGNQRTIFDLEYGDYEVKITDVLGAFMIYQVSFSVPTDVINLDIYAQLEALCDSGMECLDYDFPEAPFFTYNSEGPIILDASIGVNNPNVIYEWFEDERPLNTNGPVLILFFGSDCKDNFIKLARYKVIATNTLTNCKTSQAFMMTESCPQENLLRNGNLPKADSEPLEDSVQQLETKVYPNPTDANNTFTYEIIASYEFNGIVELFTVTGQKLFERNINGDSKYIIPFNLGTSGTYLIRTTCNDGKEITDRIIIK